MHDRFQVQLLGGEHREAVVERKAHLMAEHRQRAGAGAVALFHAALEDMFHQIEVLAHRVSPLPTREDGEVYPARQPRGRRLSTAEMAADKCHLGSRRILLPSADRRGDHAHDLRPHSPRPHPVHLDDRRLGRPHGVRRLQQDARHQSEMDAACALPRGLADFQLCRLRPARLRADLVARARLSSSGSIWSRSWARSSTPPSSRP